MTRLKMTAQLRDAGTLDAKLDAKVARFISTLKPIEQQAATRATTVSRSKARSTRPLAPPRPGRPNPGSLRNSIEWGRIPGGVGLRQKELTAKAPFWIVQEIGTGEKAVTRVAGKPRPGGRPAKGASYVRTVKSQRGRRISSGLVFATGPGGTFSAPGSARGQQLYLRQRIKGVPATRNRSQPSIIINKEIEGKHFIRDGGRAGSREYRQSVLAAARQEFRKRR